MGPLRIVTVPRALSIAGSDPTGGAGIQQDLKTFHALGVWGMTAITAVTVQDSTGVRGWTAIPAEQVVAQIDACLDDIGADALKTGMLPDAAVIEAVARALDDRGGLPLVVDPVMVATSGDALTDDGAITALIDHLLPHAELLTPNADEAERLTGIHITNEDEQVAAAEAIVSLGARAVLVKGGHAEGPEAVDVLLDRDGVQRFASPRVATGDTHGSGCMLSAAIAAGLARGDALRDAVARAKRFVSEGVAGALRLGSGAGPVNAWGTGGAR